MLVDERANFEVEFFVLLRQKTSGFPTAIGARSVQFVSRGTFRPLSARGWYPMGPGPTAVWCEVPSPHAQVRWLFGFQVVLRVSVTVGFSVLDLIRLRREID